MIQWEQISLMLLHVLDESRVKHRLPSYFALHDSCNFTTFNFEYAQEEFVSDNFGYHMVYVK